MKVLVVGGAGYIGGAVTDCLLQKSIPFSVYDYLLYENHYLKPVDFIYGDIRDTDRLKTILDNYTHVIWPAAIVGDGACQKNPQLTKQVNQDGVYELCANYKGRIIFTSTCSVYGANDNLLDETSPTNPLSVYAQAKLQAEKFLTEENSLIFRLGTAFGIGDNYSRPRMDLALNYMTASALTKGKLQVYGGDQWRPMAHVKDIAETIVHNLDRPVRGIYNLTTFNTQISNLGKIISDMTGATLEVTERPFEDRRNYRVSSDKAVRDGVINLNTTRTMQDGIREIMTLVKNGRMKYSDNDIYSNEKYIEHLLTDGKLS